ncbi:hypothetical protein O6H91_05G133100 [Diphasiastrum complanatum]|nr:hypothetical protein O6H91_05G132500 [Diphasiastrum complanatum]KAJ7557567.1 hypothetical protein O6H91_05G132500 [Diphasiastrum complanatum]KAJ7557587.1 hypothetical protein O6H91_05G133100 [Diphasiastrum complanatum]
MGLMFCQGATKTASADISHPLNGREMTVCASLLELAADNDLEGFKKAIEGGARIDQPEAWYCRQIGTNQMAMEQRTAIMIASLYGSIEVLRYILSICEFSNTDVNLGNGSDGLTALHCAAAGGSSRADEALKLLLEHGADINVKDAHGRRPADVVMVSPKILHESSAIQGMLKSGRMSGSRLSVDLNDQMFKNEKYDLDGKLNFSSLNLVEENNIDNFGSGLFCKINRPLPTSSVDSFSSHGSSSPPYSPVSPSSPKSPVARTDRTDKICGDTQDNPKGYLSDSSIPDIKNSIYTTDEFRMFSFKVRPCSRAYSHDWTECPFVHPGENARRRDPRRYHYSCVPCPDFRKGACRRGDACEYAHGVFECWLHPAQYRTRLCKDGTSCARRVCFFAHRTEELRPLYVSTGSAVPSPRASSAFDSRSTSPPLQPLSPASMLLGPFSPSNKSGSTPPMSPSASSLRTSLGATWSQPNIPTLNLPSGGLHASRLRAALNARDVPLEDLDEISDLDPRMAPAFLLQSNQVMSSPTLVADAGIKASRMGKYSNLGLSIPSTNLQDLFVSEMNSPKAVAHANSWQELAQMSPKMNYQFQNQLQLQMNPLHSPRSSQSVSHMQNDGCSCAQNQISHSEYLNTGSPRSVFVPGAEAGLPSSPSVSLSPCSSLGFSNLKTTFGLKDKGGWSSTDSSGPVSSLSWSDWGSPSGKPDWGVEGHNLGKFRKASSFASHGGIEPDLSWVQTLVKDGPGDAGVGPVCSVGDSPDVKKENLDRFLGAWIEQARQNQVVA